MITFDFMVFMVNKYQQFYNLNCFQSSNNENNKKILKEL